MLPLDPDGAPITHACFDPTEELVWCASGSGMIYSHMLPMVEPYSAFRCDPRSGAVPTGIFPNPYGLIAVSQAGVHFFTKGGMKVSDVELPEVLCATCGCLLPSQSRLAVVSTYEPSKPCLTVLDLNSAQVATKLDLDVPATLARYDPHASMICLSGGDGTVAVFDVRAGRGKPAGRCPLFPSKNQVVCSLDLAGNTICASALRSQLGPLGTQDLVFDTSLRTLDIRSMRPSGSGIYCAEGAASLRGLWPPALRRSSPAPPRANCSCSTRVAAWARARRRLPPRAASSCARWTCRRHRSCCARAARPGPHHLRPRVDRGRAAPEQPLCRAAQLAEPVDVPFCPLDVPVGSRHRRRQERRPARRRRPRGRRS